MIGKIFITITPFFNNYTHQTEFKKRPFLVIGKADQSDYVVLPVSRVTAKQHLDLFYDYEIDPMKYPKSYLNAKSYIRTHKQTVVRRESLTKEISDFKNTYPKEFAEIMKRVHSFQENLYYQSK